ncbi:MAG TPA: Hpt domain-containing protein, partial [Thermosynergistes sp.]|nr:Hpt domain-containing protein [Thermosynergistes sp.]
MDLDMKEYLNAFLDESSEQLELLGDLLLSLESNPEQPEVVNEIFRVAHTLKGMAGAMGFDGMASLTHAMEDLLDLMRKGELAITGDDVSLLFRCLDTLQVMIDQIRKGGRDGDVDGDELLKTLKAKVEVVNHHEATKSQTPIGLTSQEVEWVKKAQDQGMKVYHLAVHLDPQCLLKSARAYLVVSRLEGMGEIIKTVPPVEELEKEGFDYTFEVYLATKEGQETVRRTVMSISEIANVEIDELTS